VLSSAALVAATAATAVPLAPPPSPPAIERAQCPPGLARCVEVTGRVVLVERVDPDGDGDLHVVLAAGSLTAPGLTAVDVRPGLRPREDPRLGDLVSAAGQVQRGSFGQRQVHASEVRFP